MTMPASQVDELTPAVIRDRRLLQRYSRDGSEDAFHELVQRHLRLVHATCLRELGDAALAEDAAQIVFLILARKAPTLMLGQSLAGWLFVTARYTANDLRKREARRRQHETALENADPSSLRYEDFAWSFIDPNLNDALMTLNRVDREAVLLRFFEQRSYKEVGDHLALSEAAAARRVARALVKLRRQLINAGFAASVSALAALLTERAARAVTEQLVAAVTKIGVGTPHAFPAALTAKAAVISQHLARSTRALQFKTATGIGVATIAGIVLLKTTVNHPVVAHSATTKPFSVAIASDPSSDASVAAAPAPRPSRPIRPYRPTSTKTTAPAPIEPGGEPTWYVRTPIKTARAASTPAVAAKPLASSVLEVSAVPASPAVTTSTGPTHLPRYTVVPIPDDDPQSTYVAFRRAGREFRDADRPVAINDSGEILYRCGDVYRWDGSSLTFERRTLGLPRRVPLPTVRYAKKNSSHSELRQVGNRQVAVDVDDPAPDQDTQSADDKQPRYTVAYDPVVAAGNDDAGNVLGIGHRGVFIESSDCTATYVCRPGSMTIL